uniref:HAT C-terminal dimerisation domain-containing protein n=1 Tax=Astyanax mexicanus TaxID=7994 RepID=A0A3B1K3A6_ASTMX
MSEKCYSRFCPSPTFVNVQLPFPHLAGVFTLCPRTKTLSTSCVSNSNLMKHLSTAHASIKLVAQEYTGNTASVDEGSANKEGPPPCKQQKLDFSASVPQKLSQRELNGLIGAYIVENMLSISTVESDSFRALIGKIPRKGGAGPPCRKTFSKYIDAEYAKMNSELKKEFEQLEYLATTADIWIAHNKSYLGVTAHWMHPANFQRKKAALACRRFKGRHTHESIAIELDNIHSSFGISHKITATVTDNGSNFVKAFKRYQSVEEDDSVDEEDDEVTFVDMNDALQSRVDEDDDVINLPPHYRCASHILNLVSCSDIEKWILSRPEKAVYRSATAKCTALWNKASRSTVAAETVEDVVAKKLIVPCSTRWNSFYDALARICEISIVDLNTISSKFGSKAITEKEHQFLKEYCIAMKPLTVALDILQGICYHGTLLPTLETLMMKTLELKRALQILVDLPEAIVEVRTTFLDSALLAAVTLPRFKLRWLRTQERKDKAKAELLDAFFSFDDEDDISATAESQVADYLKSGAQGMDSLHGFPLIKRISLKHNAATPSSAPVERLFSLGKLVFTPKRNRLSDLKFEKLLLLRYNHWFTG